MSKNEVFENYIISHDLDFYDSFENENLELSDTILKGIYSYGFERPSPIQRVAIKPIKDGKDIVLQSHSGTGKTATFIIGLLSRINVENKSTQGIIICNTRELADQTCKVFKFLAQYTNITYSLCIGGDMQFKYVAEQMKEHVIIEVGVGIPLGAHHLLNAAIAKARPAVGGKHHFGLAAKAIEGLINLLAPFQRVPDQGTAQRINIVDGAGDVFRRPEGLVLGEPGVHFSRRFRAGRVLKHHGHAIDGDLFKRLVDDAGRCD